MAASHDRPRPVLGKTSMQKGFVTRLNALGPTGPDFAETMLGFRNGRLAAGYWLLLLAEPLRPNQVRFGGGTQFSDGRLGLPEKTAAADRLRKTVHDSWQEQHGAPAIARMQAAFARDPDNLRGERRIVKLVAMVDAEGDNPAEEYPPGRQAPQYILTEPHAFLVAAEVNLQMIARNTAGQGIPLAPGAPALTKKLLYDWLKQVKVA